MSKIYIAADLHLGHEKLALLRGFSTLEEHDETIIANWNHIVTKRDSVFVLGDVCFGQKNLHKLGQLLGTKKLIMGNHDKYPITSYLPYFSQVFGCVKYKGYILSHVPVHEGQFNRFTGNIHGHLHDRTLDDKRYICVSAEQTEFKPRLFEELVGKRLIRSYEDVPCSYAEECFNGNRYGKGCFEDHFSSIMGGKPWQECHCMTDYERKTIGN